MPDTDFFLLNRMGIINLLKIVFAIVFEQAMSPCVKPHITQFALRDTDNASSLFVWNDLILTLENIKN
jgi:hypothetical protein